MTGEVRIPASSYFQAGARSAEPFAATANSRVQDDQRGRHLPNTYTERARSTMTPRRQRSKLGSRPSQSHAGTTRARPRRTRSRPKRSWRTSCRTIPATADPCATDPADRTVVNSVNSMNAMTDAVRTRWIRGSATTRFSGEYPWERRHSPVPPERDTKPRFQRIAPPSARSLPRRPEPRP